MQIKPGVIDVRVQRRIAELDHYRFTYRERTDGWTVSRDWPERIPKPEAVAGLLALNTVDASEADETHKETRGEIPGEISKETPGETPRAISLPFSAPGTVTQTYWLSAGVAVPDSLADGPVYLRMPTNSESMVYLNGQAWQGLDENRSLVRLNPHGKADASYRLDVMLFTARDRKGKSFDAELVCLDEAVWAYQHELRTVLGVARSLPEDDATAIGLWQALVRSINAIDFHRKTGKANVGRARELLETQLEALRSAGHAPKPVDVHMVGNSHIDVTWLWTLDETRQKMGRTTATALRYIDELPDYYFVQSQAQIYDYLREDFPDLFEQVKRRVAEGRWEPIGAAWIEPDCNVTGGESLVRQILYGQKFWREHFGRESRTFWLPDTFGYAWALPQILVKSGLDSFMTQKLTWSETNNFPYGHFDWEGVDGSRIRCTFPQTYVSRTFPDEIAGFYERFPSKDTTSSFFYLYGYGDGGGGPVREDVELGKRLADMPGFPRCRFSTAEPALAAVRENADRRATETGRPIPVWKGELYLEFHRGTLTTHARVKHGNRKCELALRDAEIFSVRADMAGKRAYPAEELEHAWKKVLLNQFHDIVPGTSIPDVYPEVHRLYGEVLSTTTETVAAGIEAVTQASDDCLSVFNTLSWEVTDWVEAEVETKSDFHLEDAAGETVPHQFIGEHSANGENGGRRRIGFEATVPGLGSAVYRIREGDKAPASKLIAEDGLLENERFRVRFDDKAQISSVFDKHLEREWLDAPGNRFQTFDDRPNSWEAWDLNDWYEERPLDLLSIESARVIETGPVRAVIRFVHASPNGSRIEQDVAVYATIPRIDFLTRMDWRDERVLLKVAFPVAVHSAHATYDIQFGNIARPTHKNTSWDDARFEVCGHKWTDLSEGNGGVSLLNDSKYGHDIQDQLMRITLLRNPTHPDARCPTPSYLFPDQESEVVFTDTDTHETRYAFYPHAGDWRNGTVAQAYAFNCPLRAVAGRVPAGELRVSTTPGVVLESFKKAEDGDGYIVRVYEAHGGRQAASIDFGATNARIASAAAVDLMERPSESEGPLEIVDDRSLRFFIKPYEIRSFRLGFESA